MKIGIMGGWNLNSGASFHAEMIGRPLIEMGHELTIFTFYDHSYYATAKIGKDEDYVIKCFTRFDADPPQLDAVPLITKNLDYLLIEDLGTIPIDLLAKIFSRLKQKAKIVHVVHDGKLTDNPSFYQLDWDALIAFDERYEKFLVEGYGKDKVHIIPYPAYPMRKGDKKAAREKLNLPQDKKIIFTFGGGAYAATLVAKLIPNIATLKDDYKMMLLGVTKRKDSLDLLNAFKESNIMDIEIREEAPDADGLYDYLHASDLLIVNKFDLGHVVLSSTIFQCLGSGISIISNISEFTELFGDAILRFGNHDEMKSAIRSVFDQDDKYKKMMTGAEKFVNEKCGAEIAKQFLELYKKL